MGNLGLTGALLDPEFPSLRDAPGARHLRPGGEDAPFSLARVVGLSGGEQLAWRRGQESQPAEPRARRSPSVRAGGVGALRAPCGHMAATVGSGSLPRRGILRWQHILGTSLNAAWQPLYLPGTILWWRCWAAHSCTASPVGNLLRLYASLRTPCGGGGLVQVFTAPMVRIYINSGVNAAGLASMPVALAAWVPLHVGRLWPLVTPSLGPLDVCCRQ